ncbi:Uncharacterised protein [Escherichia coli]|uniref:Uncharacterized protein n=1 Tax=Escherichia coli TaxID=562 RepID=A0A376KI22_ECOLX|nr:Uncharacterised protein [Escherichia coli]
MKRYVMTAVWPLLLCAAQAGAELRVIADIGGSDASVFYEAINRQEGEQYASPGYGASAGAGRDAGAARDHAGNDAG